LKNKNLHIFSFADDKNQYDVLKGLVSGKQVNTLTHDITLDCVKEQALAQLGTATEVYVLHDGCEIRKPDSRDLEHLGQVLSLNKTVVNGYKTMNCVVVNPKELTLHLFDHQLYSTKMPNYVKQEDIKHLSEQPESIQELVNENKHVNTSVLFKRQVEQCSKKLHELQPERIICHIADREFDSDEIFEHIDSLEDNFVIRLKLSRLSSQAKTVYTKTGKISKKTGYKKLIDKEFANKDVCMIAQLTIKGKHYTNVECLIEWEPLILNDKSYSVVRITLKQGGRNIFEHPMLLITNREIKTLESAKEVYRAYILRFKIEVVFRFLKQNLGWETIQVRDFNSIANLLAIAFFLVGYFKELDAELSTHPLALLLCQLALSKGKVTLFFLLKGLEKLANFQEVSLWMKENNITKEQVDELIEYLKLSQT